MLLHHSNCSKFFQCQFARAAVTTYYKLGDLLQNDILSDVCTLGDERLSHRPHGASNGLLTALSLLGLHQEGSLERSWIQVIVSFDEEKLAWRMRSRVAAAVSYS